MVQEFRVLGFLEVLQVGQIGYELRLVKVLLGAEIIEIDGIRKTLHELELELKTSVATRERDVRLALCLRGGRSHAAMVGGRGLELCCAVQEQIASSGRSKLRL